jgi:inhibitor of KinA
LEHATPWERYNFRVTIEPLGDAAFIVRDLDCPAYICAESLLDLHDPRILDVNSSYETLGVYSTPGALSGGDIEMLIGNQPKTENQNPKTHVIPMLYDGEDLGHVAKQLGLTIEELIQLHSGHSYRCFAVGFCPGFPYLGWLPEKLQGIPRMQTPRTHTVPGSVAITGKQTAVYPLDRPGGWSIIGRTPLTLVDVDDNYFPIRAGDLVSFDPLISEAVFLKLKGERL